MYYYVFYNQPIIDVFLPCSICILLLLLQEDSVNNHQSKILRRFILDSELKNQLRYLMGKKEI
jgi:hypothetical protein